MAKGKKKHNTKRHKGLKRWKQLGFFGKVWRFLWVGILAVIVFTILQVLFCALFNPPVTPLMVKRFYQQVKKPDRTINFERNYISIDDISPNLISAVNIAEDGGMFMYHRGFAYTSLKRAYINARAGNARAGGSTISQQTAKNCFLPHKRATWRKVVEAYYTVLIETIWGKKRIMECYLNIIEFGNGVYGCEAASQHYFHHSAKELSKREAALLAACLPTPLTSDPGHPSRYLRGRASSIQRRMDSYGKIDFDKKREELNPTYLKTYDEENLFTFISWMIEYNKEHPAKKK